MTTDSDDVPTDRPTPTLDDVFDLLGDERRRVVLYRLRDGPEPTDRDALAAALVAADAAPDRERATVSLDHVHLPKLADAGVVDYDPDAGTVAYVAHDLVDEWVAAAETEER